MNKTWERLAYGYAKRCLEVAAVQGGNLCLISEGVPDVARYFKEVANRLGICAKVYFHCRCGTCRNDVLCHPRKQDLKKRLVCGRWDYAVRLTWQKPTIAADGEPLAALEKRVLRARAFLDSARCEMGSDARDFLEQLARRSMATELDIHSLLGTAISIAALETSVHIKPYHIAEAMQYWPRYVAENL